MKELEFINIIKNTLTDSSFIGDDTAFAEGFVFTQDTLVEDVHFRLSTMNAFELAQKAVAVNLSDIAASGAMPCYLLISLSLPSYLDASFVESFYQGVEQFCSKYAIKVLGGDITGSEKVFVSICAIGKAKKQIKRSFAKEGDVVFTTGNHGSSRAGLEILEKNLDFDEKFILAHKLPTPKIKEGSVIAEVCDSPALMDSSDGLLDALYKIAFASDVTLEVDFETVPYDSGIKKLSSDWRDWVLFGGEDYELVGSVRESDFAKIQKVLSLHKIGHVVAKSDFPVIIKKDGESWKITKEIIENMSYDHFKKGPQ